MRELKGNILYKIKRTIANTWRLNGPKIGRKHRELKTQVWAFVENSCRYKLSITLIKLMYVSVFILYTICIYILLVPCTDLLLIIIVILMVIVVVAVVIVPYDE